MKLVQHLMEPRRLLLVWQQPDGDSGQPRGERLVVGELRQENGNIYLEYYEDEAIRSAVETKRFTGLTAYRYQTEHPYNSNVGEVLAKRVASPSRPDYAAYLRSYRLPLEQEGNLSIMQLLGYTGGALVGDGFAFALTFDDAAPPFDFTFEIAGFRHYEGMQGDPMALQDQQVEFMAEPGNQHDRYAVMVRGAGKLLGYMPKGMAESFTSTILNRYQVSATIERVNGTPERPSVLVLVEVR